MTNNDFMPQGYEVPKGESNYFKLVDGDNKFRILSKPIMGWLDWKDKEPLRFKMSQKPEPINPSKPIKHFWAMVVWNYREQKIQVFEITQPSLQKAITALAESKDWGSPLSYDININRSGAGMDTKYNLTPMPPKPLAPEVDKAYKDKAYINLDALYDGADPFVKP